MASSPPDGRSQNEKEVLVHLLLHQEAGRGALLDHQKHHRLVKIIARPTSNQKGRKLAMKAMMVALPLLPLGLPCHRVSGDLTILASQ